eukprot:TRINITY_DN4249_c0_g2_i1.p2 TRINITY_DN4249_c0_g2~~TRINITY_DN4249_c0_g2_i1.p2  ORF type:complete len:178 (+),score=14.31 TRINITY_DN4249_c0_g2_i1:137-670(+)
MKLKSARNLSSTSIKTATAGSSNKLISEECMQQIRNSRKSISDEKSCLRWPKAVFKMVETVQTDVPCDLDEESESINLSPVKTAVARRGLRSLGNSKTPVAPSKNGFDIKRHNALRTQRKLMKALFDTEICHSCLRPLVDKAVWQRNWCGHTFHADCVKGILECPDCKKTMNPIEIM